MLNKKNHPNKIREELYQNICIRKKDKTKLKGTKSKYEKTKRNQIREKYQVPLATLISIKAL